MTLCMLGPGTAGSLGKYKGFALFQWHPFLQTVVPQLSGDQDPASIKSWELDPQGTHTYGEQCPIPLFHSFLFTAHCCLANFHSLLCLKGQRGFSVKPTSTIPAEESGSLAKDLPLQTAYHD